jgi:DNA-binding MurR/RpiR family transcriptional regulator
MMVDTSLRQLMQQAQATLTASERKLARLLIGGNPTMALSTVQDVAEKAGVSAATVVRFAMKLGFSGYADFQRALIAELQSMVTSPLSLLESGPTEKERSFGRVVAEQVDVAVADMPGLDAVVEILADKRRRVYLRGGRFSHFLAGYTHVHLRQMRPNVVLLPQDRESSLDATLDIQSRDIVMLFDFRRYQDDTIVLGRDWAANGATIILFTDRWLSPATEYAQHIFISDVGTPSAFDTLVPAVAQVEYLLSRLLDALGERAADRFRQLEAIRAAAATKG